MLLGFIMCCCLLQVANHSDKALKSAAIEEQQEDKNKGKRLGVPIRRNE